MYQVQILVTGTKVTFAVTFAVVEEVNRVQVR